MATNSSTISSTLLLLGVLIVSVVSQSGVSFDYAKQQNWRTRLLGTSFGMLGINATFDYVIVGGGTSGLTVTNRLASNPNISVAVIEGGGFYELENGNISQIPAFVDDYSSPEPAGIQPLIDWGIVTVPQQQSDGREIAYSQGKCLGGSSACNYLAYQRGTAGSYQQWANNIGDQSYSFTNLLPYFQRSPTFSPPDYAKRGPDSNITFNLTAFSATGGPLQVSYSNYYLPSAPYTKSGFLDLDLEEIPGLNHGELIGFSEFTTTIDPGAETRSSSETSFLQVSLASSTLQVYQRTLAKKIIFDSNNTATGVSVVTAGKTYTLSATKEVIVAAGAFRSPQLLMVSGVGPAATLQEFNISVVSNLQGVGQNMWVRGAPEGLIVGAIIFMKSTYTVKDQPPFATVNAVNVTTDTALNTNETLLCEATEEFLQNQAGPLTSIGSSFVGWEKLPHSYRSQFSNSTLSDLSKFPADWPELEILPFASELIPTNSTAFQITFAAAVLTPTSRGNVTINSTDTDDNPVVSPNWMLTQTDQEVCFQAFRRIREFASATGITVGEGILPGPAVQTDAETLQFLKESVGTIHHASATCAMGKAGDPNAVVDSHGNLLGVNNLRVVDISSFNLLPPGHPQASVYMLAEKQAEHILNGR